MPLWKVDAPSANAEGEASSLALAAGGSGSAQELKQEAYQSVATSLIPPPAPGNTSAAQSSANQSILPPDQLPPPLHAAISQRFISLVDLIRHLRESLTSEDLEVRSLAVQLLSLVVTTFAPGTTDSDSVRGKNKKRSVAFADENAAEPVTKDAAPPPLFDRQAVLTLTTFFASKLEDGEAVSDELARRYNSSIKPVPATAGWTKQSTEGGARLGDARWLGGTVPRGSEMLAASVVALQRLVCLDNCGAEAAKTATTA